MRLPRWARWLIVGVAVLIAVVGAAAVAVTQHFDRERVTAMVAAQVERTTGRQIHFDGPISFAVLPSLALRLEGVRLANATWGTRPDMLTARQIDLVVALRPLLSRQLQIRRVVLEGVDLWVETDAEGRGNWALAPRTPKPAAGEPLQIDLARAEIHDSSVSLRDGRSGHTETLRLQDVSLSEAGAADALEARVQLREQALSVKGRVGKIADLIGGARQYPIDLTLALDGASLGAKGNIGLAADAGKASLDIDADVRATAALARFVGRALPLPLPLHLTGRLEHDGARSVVPAFKLVAAGQDLTGRVEFDAGPPRPRLTASLQAATFDPATLWPQPAAPGAATSASARLFSDAALPLTALPALDAHIDVTIARLQLPGKPALAAVHAAWVLSDGQLVVQPLAFRIGSGSVDGMASLRVRNGASPSLALRLRSNGVTLEELQGLAGAGSGISGGRTDVQLELDTRGASLHQWARGLNGNVLFKADRMRLTGALGGRGGDLLTKLVEAIDPFRKQDKGSSVNCLVARLPLRGGVITIDRSIALEGEKLDVVAVGSIDLGAETLDLAVRPTVKEGLGVGTGNLAQLVKVSGSLADPHVGVNLKGVAREGLSVGAAVATGGLSLLGERLLRKRTDPHPCAAALGTHTSAAPARETSAEKKGFRLPNPLGSTHKR